MSARPRPVLAAGCSVATPSSSRPDPRRRRRLRYTIQEIPALGGSVRTVAAAGGTGRSTSCARRMRARLRVRWRAVTALGRPELRVPVGHGICLWCGDGRPGQRCHRGAARRQPGQLAPDRVGRVHRPRRRVRRLDRSAVPWPRVRCRDSGMGRPPPRPGPPPCSTARASRTGHRSAWPPASGYAKSGGRGGCIARASRRIRRPTR